MSRLLRHFALILCLMLFASFVAACGDDDDDTDDATPTSANVAPTPTDEPEATATEPGATPTTAASPTSATSATGEATEPEDDDATPTASAVDPTEPSASPTATSLTPEEQALMAILLSPNDLPGEWTELRREVSADDDDDDPGFCGSGEFPRGDEKIAQVEVEMQSGDNASFILQNLTEFEEETAIEAMAFARDSFSCSEFTDEDGTTIHVEPTDAEDLGDESFAVKTAFQVADAGELTGDIYFVRVGGLISIATVLELDNYEPETIAQVAEIAADKMHEAAGKTVGLEPEQEALIGALITQSDLPQGWNVLSTASPTDPEGWTGLCDAPVNPDAANAIARVSVDYYEGLGDSDATVQQVITAYPEGGGDDAMIYERDSVSCAGWTTGQTTITLTPADYASDADDTFAVEFAYEDEQAGAVSGNWIVVQVGDFVANIIYTDPEGVDPDLAQGIIDAAVDRMRTVSAAGL